MARRRRSSRRPACASSASARPRSASSERSWNSSNRIAPTPSSIGSSEIMRVNTPSVTTRMRVRGDLALHADDEADRLADLLAERLRHAGGRGAAASRRGSAGRCAAAFQPCLVQKRQRDAWSLPRRAGRPARRSVRRARPRAGRAGPRRSAGGGKSLHARPFAGTMRYAQHWQR